MDAMTPPDMMEQGGQPNALAQLQAVPAAPPKPVTHDVKIATTKKLASAKVMGVPPEEFGIERGARTIADCNYCFHETVKTVDELTSQGFDKSQLNDLISDRADGTEDLSRDTVDETLLGRDTMNKSARPVRVTEHYIRMDYEGKGRACIYRVTTAGEGGEILKREGKEDIERVDVYPFAATTPVPVTHRFFGRSMADLVMQTQREKTALKRGALDNMYLHNNPRPEIAESHAGPNTIDDLLVSRHGAPIRTKTPGGLNWQVWPDITGSIYPLLQYLDADLEAKTGVSKQSQGIDANALQNQSATAVAQVFSASQLRMKLIARIMAEGVRDIFSLLHGTIRKHGQQKETVRLRNKWVPVDPRQWKTRADMTINVGLGTGAKAQQFAQIMALANVQKEMIAGGKGHLVGDKELYETAAELTKIMGHKNPDRFFNDPDEKDEQGQPKHPPQPPPEDPAVQVAKVKAQTDQQALQAKSQLDAQADERKAQIETVQAQADMATEREKLQGEMQLAQQKFELERELKLMDFQLKKQMYDEEMQMRREQHQQQMEADVFKVAAGAEQHGQKMEQGEQSHEAKMAAAKAKPKAGK
jgi:hypothetical protein